MQSSLDTTPTTQELLLLEHAVDALKASTGLKAAVRSKKGAGQIVHISSEENTHNFGVWFKNIDRRAAVAALRTGIEPPYKNEIVVTRKMTSEMARECRNMGVQFLDIHGNAFLKAPNLFVYIEGRTDPLMQGIGSLLTNPSAGLVTTSALRLVFILLTQAEFIQKPFRDIAQSAGISLGTVSAVFSELTERGHIKASKKLGRQLLNTKNLQYEWAVNFDTRLRPKLLLGRYRSAQPNWWENADLSNYDAVWSGDVAADRMTGYLRPGTCTIYLAADNAKHNLRKLTRDHRLLPDPQGDIELLEAFWPFSDTTVCPPLLVYADLLSSLNPRSLEAAELILKEYLS
jgi:hypothetical protein